MNEGQQYTLAGLYFGVIAVLFAMMKMNNSKRKTPKQITRELDGGAPLAAGGEGQQDGVYDDFFYSEKDHHNSHQGDSAARPSDLMINVDKYDTSSYQEGRNNK